MINECTRDNASLRAPQQLFASVCPFRLYDWGIPWYNQFFFSTLKLMVPTTDDKLSFLPLGHGIDNTPHHFVLPFFFSSNLNESNSLFEPTNFVRKLHREIVHRISWVLWKVTLSLCMSTYTTELLVKHFCMSSRKLFNIVYLIFCCNLTKFNELFEPQI